MTPIEIYKRGLKDGVEFCVKILRDMPLSEPLMTDMLNVVANSIERNMKDVLKEYDLDHSAAKEKRGN